MTMKEKEIECKNCDGTGLVPDYMDKYCDIKNCPVCKGRGTITEEESKIKKPCKPILLKKGTFEIIDNKLIMKE